jgi:hypothetical protein
MADCSLREMLGIPEDLNEWKVTLTKLLEPLILNHEAIIKSLGIELEPLIRYVRSEEYQNNLRAMASDYESLSRLMKAYSASDWIKDYRLATHRTRRNAEPLPKPKPILGFLGGVKHE